MAKLSDFTSLLDAFNTETNRIAAKIDELVAQSQRTDMTAAEEAQVLADYTALADRLRTIGASATDPIPPV